MKKERQEIHERIAAVIEKLFKDRLSEFYETIAYHYANSKNNLKAVEYQSRSGEKCLKRYSLDEAHQYFSDAYELTRKIDMEPKKKDEAIISSLIKWAPVFYYRGEFKSFLDIVEIHKKTLETIEDKSLIGRFYGWLGFFTYELPGKSNSAYKTLLRSMEISKKSGDKLAIAYCYTWLVWVCCEEVRLDEAEYFGHEALALSNTIENDHYLFFKLRAGLAFLYFLTGKIDEAKELSESIILKFPIFCCVDQAEKSSRQKGICNKYR